MNSFAEIERDVFHSVANLRTSVNIVGTADDLDIDILAKLTEDLCLTEPVSVSILIDESGSHFYNSTSPIGAHIISLALNLASDSVMNDKIIDYQCRSLVSFPERLANEFADSKRSVYVFNSQLYWERLCDTILLFYFTKPQHSQLCTGSLVSPCRVCRVLDTIVTLLLRRGNLNTVMQRIFLLPNDLFQSAHFSEQFPLFIGAVFEASKLQRFSLKLQKENCVSQLWHQFNLQLFFFAEKRPELKTELVNAVGKIINNFATETSSFMARALFESIFVNSYFFLNSSRTTIRTIFKDLLGVVAGNDNSKEALTSHEQTCFTALFNLWDNKEFVTSGNLSDNLNLLHPVMYALLYLKEKYPEHDCFPPKYVGALLNGVSIRLSSTRGTELRTCAMTAAAAFATLFVSNPDGATPLTQDAEFSRALENWMRTEPSADNSVFCSQNTQQASKAKPERNAAFARRGVALNDVYPLDPDEKYTFFVTPEQRNRNDVVKKVQQGIALQASPHAFSPSALPAFGQQKFAKDDLGDHVSILRSVRECYNALIGIGRGPNAQLHEVQEATESGLRGLSSAFAKLRNQMGSDLFKSVSREIGPLIPVLLPALISLDIHAPEEEKQFLQQLRYETLVNLIVLNAPQSLNQVSGMLYRSNYGVYQRNELIKAIGEAALLLSRVQIDGETSQSRSGRIKENGGEEKKRIYPPIPTHHLSGEQKAAIVVTEGQQTRRWGNANTERSQRQAPLKHYNNLLGEVASAFVAAFLYKLDADHFAFFQESDPYTPCAILDSLTMIFQGITNVRHIAPDLCEKHFDFFFAVGTKHPNLTVKKAAWTSIVEMMRTWCGVGPLWIRQKDGQRVLNRDAGLHHSLMFTKNWIDALDLLQHTCEKMLQSNDSCSLTASIAVSSLRDLVYDRDDFQTMLSRSEEISLGE
ncbi:hypothetical protein ABB37_00257 [Leptomonas pyrrhocoris]|uniref:Telomere length regulation protein conserved domain-containing protein n=1 Tax=Leptomonas pyrrhocoris TaxID=157538 RepID=A0A0N0VHQ7_LEPPY|nr:hypothetical protein ABB37_00257 [Leptomonas pyrrhocoris]KPA85961.1 hypothetical protein ABB37_00257 [Leptomonas pyrrhocoris]|eukprot:XP_015664400.1 hypothetical protein ABB37_00257 [Leptomonas pyrrhocoris]